MEKLAGGKKGKHSPRRTEETGLEPHAFRSHVVEVCRAMRDYLSDPRPHLLS